MSSRVDDGSLFRATNSLNGEDELDTALRPRYVPIGPFKVIDASTSDVVTRLATTISADDRNGCHVAYALHVGALLRTDFPGYVASMNGADTIYADGASVVLLAKAAGAQWIERSPTTDIGWDVLRSARRRLGRPARVALVGGPVGLAERASDVLNASGLATCVASANGYVLMYDDFLETLLARDVEIIFVGLGMPYEALWVESHRSQLGDALVMTCGGWFGFIVEDERRSPRWMQRIGLEWTWRVAQDPSRLARRYAVGALRTAQYLPNQLRVRSSHR